jgi:hypothetical protein
MDIEMKKQMIQLHRCFLEMFIAILFAGSQRAGERAANIMSLVQSAKLNGHDPYRYLKDVLERLPTHPASRLEELLPHHWQPSRA